MTSSTTKKEFEEVYLLRDFFFDRPRSMMNFFRQLSPFQQSELGSITIKITRFSCRVFNGEGNRFRGDAADRRMLCQYLPSTLRSIYIQLDNTTLCYVPLNYSMGIGDIPKFNPRPDSGLINIQRTNTRLRKLRKKMLKHRPGTTFSVVDSWAFNDVSWYFVKNIQDEIEK